MPTSFYLNNFNSSTLTASPSDADSSAGATRGDCRELARSIGVLGIGLAAGLTAAHNLRSMGPCPWCSATTRGSADRRPPIGITADDGGWRCFACGNGGDAWSLALRLFAKGPASSGTTDPALYRSLVAADGRAAVCYMARAEWKYPTRDEVLDLWNAASPVAEDGSASAWLMSRSLDPGAVDAAGLARALGHEALPGWAASGGRSWTDTDHRLLVPLFTAEGEMASVQARTVGPEATRPKALYPAGYRASWLVMADATGVAMLRGHSVSDLVIVEGIPDFLTAATRWGRPGTAILGISSGSWSPEIASRVPDGVPVYLRVHSDATGNAYAAMIHRTLADRCPVFRPVSG